jgi:arabinofuranosyltransferase
MNTGTHSSRYSGSDRASSRIVILATTRLEMWYKRCWVAVALHSSNKLNQLDWLFAISLALFTLLYSVRYIDFSVHPFEDAAMLMRYAQHLAQGHGIVWNIGEKPLDGATDFLFMVLLAALTRGGMLLEVSVRFMGIISHILTVVLVYVAIRKLHGSARWMGLFSAAYLAMGPALGCIAYFFGAPFFALFSSVTWYLANKLLKDYDSHVASCMFSLSGLILGLVRPEGVFLALFMLLSVLYMNGLTRSRKVVLWFGGVFSLIGGFYLFWRWGYFGYPFPNPFYKKGGGYLYLSSFKTSVKNVIYLCLPFILAFVAGFRSSKIAKRTVFSLIPVVGFTTIWILLSGEMNFFMRFQYAILPIVLISWPPLLNGIGKDWKLPELHKLDGKNRITLTLVILIILFGILERQHRLWSNIPYYRDGRYDVAVMLAEYSHRNYTIATTEAGLLPLYSNWRAIDAWGLNDQWIAHNGRITESYLERYQPQVIMFHAYFSPIVPPRGVGTWFSMVMTLKNYAEKNGYHLAAAFGDTPYDTHYYYVRPDFPENTEIIRKIQNMDYFWYGNGRRSTNYVMLDLSDDQQFTDMGASLSTGE